MTMIGIEKDDFSKEFLAEKYPKGYLDVRQISILLRVDKKNVYQWIREGILPATKMSQRHTVDLDDFFDFVYSNHFFDNSEYMSIEKTADYLRITVEDLKALTNKRLMPFVFRKNKVKFQKRDIDEWREALLESAIQNLLKTSEVSAEAEQLK